ncbi:arginase [Deinococcus sp. HSC-46F16]|uniref:arginase family protein n=1 Tax=Deinococcus sp. HSC-46F16 TaxID=2910968 RepID=UPI0020A1BDEB|nr:arginase family protein [Deinococcus sp. HSC-46F16]MCP2014019.1 arginase [Deinococcus sp. HSC-46F16]
MQVTLLELPYDSAWAHRRMGAGPRHLLENGLEQDLREHHDLDLRRLQTSGDLPTEIHTSFALYRQLAQQVQAARQQGRYPLALAGNCGAALGMLAGLQNDALGVIWLDAHGDFHTPETTSSGFLDGMALATLTGQAWQTLAASIPGFRAIGPQQVLHIGGQDLEDREREAAEAAGMQLVAAQTIREAGVAAALADALQALQGEVRQVYVHVDLDVLDAQEVGPANTYATGGGLTTAQVLAILDGVQQVCPLVGASVASYDPSVDAQGRVLAAARQIAAKLIPERPSLSGPSLV